MTENARQFWNEKRDAFIAALLFIGALALYCRTLAPSVAFLFDDTLELQYVVPRLGIIHQTGYPLYALLGKLFTLIVPLNDPAFRLNLFSALIGALAVAMLYLVACHLTAHRAAALIAALTFAVSETFWAQAVIAETYTTQMLIVGILLYLMLTWREEHERGNADNARRRFLALAFMLGLGLTHHRLILLLYPAIALYVVLVNRTILRDFKMLARAIAFFAAPLLLYLYLPLRGNVGSADGSYENTLSGFIAWVTAQQYFSFFGNPLNVQHDAAYFWTLFNAQFTLVGLALAALGIVGLLRQPREWILLVAALIAEAGFAFNYHTANVYVHFLTTFLLVALFIGAGVDALFSISDPLLRSGQRFRVSFFRPLSSVIHLALTLLLLIIPLNLLQSNYAANDLSQKWDTYDYGVDVLTQPFENNSTVIGILGEMTLLRYFQETQGLRPDVQTIAADQEDARLIAIDNALKQNRAVYLTRSLKGAPEKYSLSSVGPLIRVQTQPITTVPPLPHPFDADFGAVRLLGYDLKASFNTIPRSQHAENGKSLRVTLYWQVEEKMADDALVSIKILRADHRVFGQIDQRPVRDAYPTNAWRPGEIIADTYDVPLFFGVTPGEYVVNVTLYDAQSSAVIGQADLQKIALGADSFAPRRETWNIGHTLDADFGALTLVGSSRDVTAPIRPGDALPLTLLWRAGWQKPPANLTTRLWLEDAQGKQVASRDALISAGYPPFQWQPNMYVRDWSAMRVPANVADGTYAVKLAVARGNELLGSTILPFVPTVVDLGKIEIKNRARMMTAPTMAHALDAVFDQKMKLLGYDVKSNAQQKNAQLILYWRALAQMDTSYAIFVHLLDAPGKVVASGDAVPGNGNFPTTGWIEDEYITDAHMLSLDDVPAGTYRVEIGVYDPMTGTRLNTTEGHNHLILTTVTLP